MSLLKLPGFQLCRKCFSIFHRRISSSAKTSSYTCLETSNYFLTYRHRSLTSVASGRTSTNLNKRVPRKKAPATSSQSERFKVTAYATASSYLLEDFMAHLEQEGLYENNALPTDLDDVRHLTAKYLTDSEPRNIVLFRHGTVVFWNIPAEERYNFLKSLRLYESEPYDKEMVKHESETLDYVYSTEEDGLPKSRIKQDLLVFAPSDEVILDRYVFSDGLMQSVQLAVWEASLANYIESIEEVTEDLRHGGRLQLSRKEVLQKTGELFNLSHLINLSSDLLDTPDFYWDRDQLERLYRQSQTYFNIRSRTKVMNNKLSHCMDLVDLLRDHLNTKHEVRLEWMIIALILVEVIFEIVHVVERKVGSNIKDSAHDNTE